MKMDAAITKGAVHSMAVSSRGGLTTNPEVGVPETTAVTWVPASVMGRT